MKRYERKFKEYHDIPGSKTISEYTIRLVQDTNFGISRIGLFKDGKEMLYTSTGVYADIKDLFDSLYKSTFKTIQKN